MRHIGNLPEETKARAFGDFLLANGIQNSVESDAGTWSLWVMDEDRVKEAQSWLEKFRANPNTSEFRSAQAEAEKVRRSQAEDLASYQKRVRTARNIFPGFGRHGIGFLTYALIFICVIVATFSQLGENKEFLKRLYIMDIDNPADSFLGAIFSRDIWRLITPIFIHYGPVHLLFNMLWLFQLGCLIETRRSTWLLALLVLGIGVISNVAQLYFSRDPTFGGMSGVVYGLAGYVWIRGRHDRSSGLFLDQQSLVFLLIWLVLCYSGMFGPIANTAHLAGLITGLTWGGITAIMANRK